MPMSFAETDAFFYYQQQNLLTMQNTQKVFYQTGSLEIKQKPTCQLKNLFESAKASGQTTRSN